MAQSRRTSTTKYTGRQVPAEISDSLKNILHQVQQSTPAVPATNQAKSRRSSPPRHQRANCDITKQNADRIPHPGEASIKGDSVTKPLESENPIKDATGPVSPATPMENPVRHVVSESVYPGTRIKMIISLPASPPPRIEPDLKKIVSSESLDDVESTTKGDLQFSPEGSTHLTE
jgi:hypothetical protein